MCLPGSRVTSVWHIKPTIEVINLNHLLVSLNIRRKKPSIFRHTFELSFRCTSLLKLAVRLNIRFGFGVLQERGLVWNQGRREYAVRTAQWLRGLHATHSQWAQSSTYWFSLWWDVARSGNNLRMVCGFLPALCSIVLSPVLYRL